MDFAHQLIAFALKQLGSPYIWAGRGDYAVRDAKVVPIESCGVPPGLAFDCAGLVGWAAWKAGAADLRGWWGADHFLQRLPEPAPGEVFRLALYGHDGHATHVKLALGNGLFLEASGGDSTTLTFKDALVRGAQVRIGFENRRDFIAFRSLDGLQSLPMRP